MLLPELRQEVLEANLALPEHGLVTFTWGNVSGIDREKGWVVIKPSGISYARLGLADLVVLDLEGKVVEGKMRPSSDTPTHLELYRRCPTLGGVVHTHSTHATAWAQACMAIPAFGTTHADYFHGEVPCSRALTREEVDGDYELNTGRVIIEALAGRDPLAMPGLLVREHGPFAWGSDAAGAVHNAVVLEEVATMAWLTRQIRPGQTAIPDYLLDKHYLRKHGAKAYYGQPTDA
ncbi:L-ribulose-5-phosphate 4-epimerase [Paludibacterium yongneupense]|uniref:L-ribulose-5-phosphate 4-epimerase n=1 Tax=Paludibacterium yongneupense TaxID=400061 RepID=UPI0004279BB4|nr:L-ribulose-5-phosphate 4-epimerase [Paludibacterium yongneupense]